MSADTADTNGVRQTTDPYFVRLDVASPSPPTYTKSGRTPVARDPFEPAHGPVRHRRRRRLQGRSVFMVVVLLGLGGWFAWAAQRPGGVSGTINSWIEHVRGEVAKVSGAPDLPRAAHTMNEQFSASGAYPQLSEDQLATLGVGLGVSYVWCTPQDVVLQGASGGGIASRLLVSGKDLGTVVGKYGCPDNLVNLAPWKKP